MVFIKSIIEDEGEIPFELPYYLLNDNKQQTCTYHPN